MNSEKKLGLRDNTSDSTEACCGSEATRVKKGLKLPSPLAGLPYPGNKAVIDFSPGIPKLLKGPSEENKLVRNASRSPYGCRKDRPNVPLPLLPFSSTIFEFP